MRTAKIDRHTDELSPPEDWDAERNGPCGRLYVRSESIEGVHFMRSAWEVEPQEAALLSVGAKLILGVAGQAHPVVHMALESVPDDFPLYTTSRRIVALDGQPAVHVEVFYANRGDAKRGMVDVVLNGRPMSAAVAEGIEVIAELARQNGWVE